MMLRKMTLKSKRMTKTKTHKCSVVDFISPRVSHAIFIHLYNLIQITRGNKTNYDIDTRCSGGVFTNTLTSYTIVFIIRQISSKKIKYSINK